MNRRSLIFSVTALLSLQIAIVVTGAMVRLTGSGLGCPEWPKCTADSYRPDESLSQFHAWIEFGNRLFTFALFAAALIALLMVYRAKRNDLRLLAWLQLVGILSQGVLGGITVLTDLHPASVASHLLLSMLLIAGATSLRFKAKLSAGNAVQSNLTQGAADHPIAKALVAIAYLTLIAGTVVTGSGPHAGDSKAPRFDLALESVAKYHSTLVALTLALTLFIAIRFPRPEANWLLAAIFLQGLIGYIQWWTGLPKILVGAHLLGAALFWMAVWRVRLSFKYPYLAKQDSDGYEEKAAV